MSECWTCHHPASTHEVETAGDPMSFAPCSATIGPAGSWLRCDCDDYDGTDHPDRPSLGSTLIFSTEDGGIGWVADPESGPLEHPR
jgi:hypothetical protein